MSIRKKFYMLLWFFYACLTIFLVCFLSIWEMREVRKLSFISTSLDMSTSVDNMAQQMQVIPTSLDMSTSVDSVAQQMQVVHTVLNPDTVLLPYAIVTRNLPPSFEQRLLFEYPPFVFSPPLLAPGQNETLPSLSPLYQQWLQQAASCNLDVCKHREQYADDYHTWTCQSTRCDDLRLSVPVYQDFYTHGVVDFIQDGILSDNYDCGWKSDHSVAVKLKQDNLTNYFVNGTVVFLVVPDGYSFQHFLDGILPKLVQIQSLLPDPQIRYLIHLRKRFPIVRELLHRIRISDSQFIKLETIMPHSGRIRAKTLVLTCQTPPLHPYLWQRGQRLLKLPWLEPQFKPTRHIVAYFSRNKGAFNGGRRLLNEEDILKTISPLIAMKGCELVTFFAKDYKTVDELFNFFSNVVAVFGPHGGALMNMLLLPRNAAVIELMAKKPSFVDEQHEVHLIMYKQSQLLGLRYYVLFGDSDGHDNIKIPPASLAAILRECL